MNTKRILILGALAGSVALSGAALAGPGAHGGGSFGQVGRVIAELDLTEAQQAQVDALREEWRGERGERGGDRQAMYDVVLTELKSDQPDRERLRGLVDQQAADHAQRAHDKVDRMLELHAILTPEQRATLVSELEENRDRMKDRMGQRRGGERGERGERRGPAAR